MKLKISLLAITLLIISNCSYGTPPGFAAIPGNLDKVKLGWEGIEFLPPQSGGWSVNREGYSVGFFKRASDTHTYVATISYAEAPKITNSEQLLSIVKKQWSQDSENNRYSIEFNNTTTDTRFGNLSTKHHKRYKDFAAANKGENKFLVLEDYGYAFIHPNNKDVMVVVLYSERFLPTEESNLSKIDREQFIQNIKLTQF